MSNALLPAEAKHSRLGKAGTLARFALIGVALAALAGTFAYLGGWFSPTDLTPAAFRRRLRGSQRRPLGLPAQSRQGNGRFRVL